MQGASAGGPLFYKLLVYPASTIHLIMPRSRAPINLLEPKWLTEDEFVLKKMGMECLLAWDRVRVIFSTSHISPGGL